MNKELQINTCGALHTILTAETIVWNLLPPRVRCHTRVHSRVSRTRSKMTRTRPVAYPGLSRTCLLWTYHIHATGIPLRQMQGFT